MTHRAPVIRVFQSPAMASPGLFLFAVILLTSSGCAWTKWGHRTELASFGPKVPCRVPPHATAEELVDHLNQNVDRLQAWRAGRVKLRANHIPLSADIAVEKNRHLRIVVNSVAGNELDIGCNSDVFWFWAKRQEPAAVMYASHDQIDLVRETLQIPFEPDWLMEALGVAEISSEGVSLEQLPGNSKTAKLVSQHTTAEGRQIRKSITVDTCHGRVLEHSIWDANGRRIAYAEFSNHRLDPASGVVLAHHIRLEWPQAEISLAMDLGQVEVNPVGLPERIWDMPHMPGYPVMNLQDLAERQGRRPVRQAEANPPVSQTSRNVDDERWQAHRDVDEVQAEPVDLDAEAETLE